MANIRDVADLAGVSTATVSRALSQPSMLADKTLTRVMAAVEELRYCPNGPARPSIPADTASVVVLVPDLSNPFFGPILSGIEELATCNNFVMLVVNTHDDPTIERRCLARLSRRQVDGVIQLGARAGEELAQNDVDRQLPFIHAIESSSDTAYPTVAIDNIRAAREIATHLTARGHRKLAIIAGPQDSAITISRMRGYREAVEAVDVEWSTIPRVYGSFTAGSGEVSAATILHRYREVTGLICMSDELAMGAIKAAHEMDIKVPNQVSVVGFDDIPSSAFYIPGITTVNQPAIKLGRVAMTMLAARLDNEFLPKQRHVLPTDIVIRSSTDRIKA